VSAQEHRPPGPVPSGSPVGALLQGRYELCRRVGRGGMADVFEGHDRLLGRRVAVKLVSRDQFPDPDSIDRLRREARAVAALEHPNVVALHDLVLTPTTTFLIMELVDGPSLAVLLREQGCVPPDEARRIAIQVCDGLDAAHCRGLVHRDISPGNLLISGAGTVKITDFGIAHGVADTFTTGAGRISGTPAYMSPEQICGIEVDARSDIYSLGCCLYLMLTGRPPFHCDTAVETATAHLRDEPPPPREIAPETPADLEAVVLRALAKDPADRYPTAAAMRAALACGAQPDPDRTASLGDTHDNRQGPMLGTHRLAPRPAQGPRGCAGEIAADIDVGPLPGAAQRRWGLLLILLGVTSLLAIAVVLILG
jgi:serine/threonine protein kinase